MQGLNAYGIGHVCFDPELRYTPGGDAVTDVRVAFNRGKDKSTLYMDFTAWGKVAEHCAQYFTKGKAIAIDGAELEQEEYEDKEGNRVVKVKAVLRKFPGFVPGGKNGNSNGSEVSGSDEEVKPAKKDKKSTGASAKKIVNKAFDSNNDDDEEIPF